MKLQKGKWYVCIRNWGDDGWTKFWEGNLIQCDNDDLMVDCYGHSHLFMEDDMPERIFREATDTERAIAGATEVNMDEFMEDRDCFSPEDTILDIYRHGAEAMLRHIREQLSIKGSEE